MISWRAHLERECVRKRRGKRFSIDTRINSHALRMHYTTAPCLSSRLAFVSVPSAVGGVQQQLVNRRCSFNASVHSWRSLQLVVNELMLFVNLHSLFRETPSFQQQQHLVTRQIEFDLRCHVYGIPAVSTPTRLAIGSRAAFRFSAAELNWTDQRGRSRSDTTASVS